MSDQAPKIIRSATGMEGVIASGNTPLWIVQPETIGSPLTDQAKTFPLAALTTATDTVKADCHMNMDGFSATRSLTNRDRKRMCEKFTQSVKTGESIDLTLTAIYDQQAGAEEPKARRFMSCRRMGGTRRSLSPRKQRWTCIA